MQGELLRSSFAEVNYPVYMMQSTMTMTMHMNINYKVRKKILSNTIIVIPT